MKKLTPSQKRSLEEIKRSACERYHTPHNPELPDRKAVFTKFEVNISFASFVSVYLVVRQLNRDEEGSHLFDLHSPRDWYTRESAHFFIGRGGKITIAGEKSRKKNRNPLIWGWKTH